LVNLAGSVVSTTIQVGARIAATARFKELAGAIAGARGGLLGFVKGAALLTGQAAILGAALRVLRSPLTQIAAVLETGLATAQWVSFQRGARRAEVQLRTLGMTSSEARNRIRELQDSLGVFAARDLFNAGDSLIKVSKLSLAWQETLFDLRPAVESIGVDFADWIGLVSEAITTNKISDIERMQLWRVRS
jgi:hypothetical protein